MKLEAFNQNVGTDFKCGRLLSPQSLRVYLPFSIQSGCLELQSHRFYVRVSILMFSVCRLSIVGYSFVAFLGLDTFSINL